MFATVPPIFTNLFMSQKMFAFQKCLKFEKKFENFKKKYSTLVVLFTTFAKNLHFQKNVSFLFSKSGAVVSFF